MQLNEYQRLAEDAWTGAQTGYDYPGEYHALAMCGEAGEIANVFKKHWRKEKGPGVPIHPQVREHLIGELGDIIWYLQALATKAGVTLEMVARANLRKLEARTAAGVTVDDRGPLSAHE